MIQFYLKKENKTKLEWKFLYLSSDYVVDLKLYF